VYWNGEESFSKATQFIELNTHDNFNEILSVFKYGDNQVISSVLADLDRAQTKGSKAIQKHSMHFKGKEYVKWIDECYLLIGKVYFYKKEFVAARRTFDFIIQEFPETDSKYEAMLWLARTYIRKGEVEKAKNILLEFQVLKKIETIPYRYLQEFPLVFADLYYQQSEFELYAKNIEAAIELSTNKQLTTRYKFILGQIYLLQKKYSEASALFNEVNHRNPDYELEFQSKLNLAKSYNAENGNSDEIKALLNKMLDDVKNIEFRDQIHYALAELALKEDNKSAAINHFRLSVAYSKNNSYQKAESSLQLANMYYNENNYKQASFYYDSCKQFIPNNFPNVKLIRPRIESLIAVTFNLQNVFEQDSLQKIASLSKEKRNQIINEMISDYKIKEKAEEEKQGVFNISLSSLGTDFQTKRGQGSKWYFYNPSTLSYGSSQFLTKWGRRNLEDNWRLSKNQFMNEDDLAGTITIANNRQNKKENAGEKLSPLSRKFYLKSLPLTPELIRKSNDQIVESLYNTSILYKENLNDSLRAYNTFSELLNRFPQNLYRLQCYYNLYKLCIKLNKRAEANQYKLKIQQKYPTSKYARIIADPQYFWQMATQKNEAAAFYEDVYDAYKNEQYFLVIDLCSQALARFNDTILTPKFDFLKTVSSGRIETVESLISNLQRIIEAYPNSEVIPLAQQILVNLGIVKNEMLIDDEAEVNEKGEFISIYSYLLGTFHNYILIVNTGSVNLDALKIRMSDFNRKNFRSQHYAISSFELDRKHQLITISRFNNGSVALNYLKSLEKDKYVLSIFKTKDSFSHFVISNKNYLLFYKDKNIQKYLKFYNRFYN
jgi:tetratricopeptide (TPR) repeat protein